MVAMDELAIYTGPLISLNLQINEEPDTRIPKVGFRTFIWEQQDYM